MSFIRSVYIWILVIINQYQTRCGGGSVTAAIDVVGSNRVITSTRAVCIFIVLISTSTSTIATPLLVFFVLVQFLFLRFCFRCSFLLTILLLLLPENHRRCCRHHHYSE